MALRSLGGYAVQILRHDKLAPADQPALDGVAHHLPALVKIDNQEADFIATKTDEKKYIQVTESMNAPETRERELTPLRKIRDNYEKLVIALDCDLAQTQDGIKVMKMLDFLLG